MTSTSMRLLSRSSLKDKYTPVKPHPEFVHITKAPAKKWIRKTYLGSNGGIMCGDINIHVDVPLLEC
jgi:hypothetical protein